MELRCPGRLSLFAKALPLRLLRDKRKSFVLLCCLPIFVSPILITLCFADDIKVIQPLPTSPAQNVYQQGLSALSAGHLAEAEANFQHGLQLDPKLISALLGLAEINILKGNATVADQYLQKASTIAPNDPNVLITRGHYLFFRKSYSGAEKEFQAAIAADPKSERARYELGDLYLLGFRKPQEAIEAYKAALVIDPKDSRVHYTMANALTEAGRTDDALAELEEASHLDPKNPALLDSLGDFCLRQGKLDQAEKAFGQALSINPNFTAARLGQGDVFVAKKDLDQALGSYRAVLQAEPKSAAVLIKIGVVQEMKGNWSEAEESYRQAVDADPKSALAANNLAWLLSEQKRKPAEALKWATKAAELAPKDFNCQDTLGWVLRGNGDLGHALAALKIANSLAPTDPQILYHLGVVYQEVGQPHAAAQSLQKALQLSSKFDGAMDAQSRLAALGSQK